MHRFLFTLLIAVVIFAPLAVFAQDSFVPLTNLPAVQEFNESSSLTDFLNNLYKICIGVAAALAVFQIMHAGVKFMTNKGSISENEQARSLIQGAVFGLILVLSPVIVFGIINPKILELNFDTAKLKSEFSGNQTTADDLDEEIDPEAPYQQGYFFRHFWANSYDAAIDGYIAYCIPDASRVTFLERPKLVGKPETIPSDLEHLIEDYTNLPPEREDCAEGMPECVDGKRYWGRCQANSHDYHEYNYHDTGWKVAPTEKDQQIEREFISGCRRDQGRVKELPDSISFFDCPSDVRDAIREEIGEDYEFGEMFCRQKRLICAFPTR